MKRHKLTLFFVFILFLIFTSNQTYANSEPAVGWIEWETQSNTPLNKTWTIKFTDEIDQHKKIVDLIYIKDSQGNKVDVTITLDKNFVIIAPPSNGYEMDHTYTLFITSDVASIKGELLSTPVKMKFSTVSSLNTFIPRQDSANEVTFTEKVKEVSESSFVSIQDTTVEIESEEAQSLNKGDVFFLPATYDHPFGIARKIEDKVDQGDTVTVTTSQPDIKEILSEIDISQKVVINGQNFIINPELKVNDQRKLLSSSNPIDVVSLADGGFRIEMKELELKKLKTTVNGFIKFEPTLNIDIDKLVFNEVSLVAKEDAEITFTSEMKGSLSDKIELGSIPLPMLGTKNLGVNAKVYLVLSMNGEVKLEYGLEQSFKMEIGLRSDPANEKFVPFSEVKNDFGAKDITLEGKAKFNAGLETGLYLLLGNQSLVDLTVSLNAENGIEGKMIDFSKDNRLNPSLCYLIEPKVIGSGNMALHEVEALWMDFGVDEDFELFTKTLYSDKLSNCTLKKLELESKVTEVKPGDKGKLSVIGTTMDLYYSEREFPIPSDYIKLSSSNENMITVDEDGTFHVNSNIEESELETYNNKAVLVATYRDPFTDKPISTTLTIHIITEEPTPPEDEENDEDPINGEDPNGNPNNNENNNEPRLILSASEGIATGILTIKGKGFPSGHWSLGPSKVYFDGNRNGKPDRSETYNVKLDENGEFEISIYVGMVPPGEYEVRYDSDPLGCYHCVDGYIWKSHDIYLQVPFKVVGKEEISAMLDKERNKIIVEGKNIPSEELAPGGWASGTAYIDLNNNSKYDGYGGYDVYVSTINENYSFIAEIDTTYLPAKKYKIGYFGTVTDLQTEVDLGEPKLTVTKGNDPLTLTVKGENIAKSSRSYDKGYVFFDKNNNGIRDGSETTVFVIPDDNRQFTGILRLPNRNPYGGTTPGTYQIGYDSGDMGCFCQLSQYKHNTKVFAPITFTEDEVK